MGGSDKLLRSTAKSQEDEEAFVQKIVERILTSDKLWSKLVDTIADKVKAEFEKRISAIEEKVIQLDAKVDAINNMEVIERIQKSNNIIIRGLPETAGDPGDQEQQDYDTVVNMLSSVVDGHNHVVTVFRLGKFTSDRSRPRLIKAEIGNPAVVKKLLRHKPGNGVYLDPDLTRSQQNIAYSVRKEYRDRRAGGEDIRLRYRGGVPEIVSSKN